MKNERLKRLFKYFQNALGRLREGLDLKLDNPIVITTHLYDEEQAKKIFMKIKEKYGPLFLSLAKKMESKIHQD